MYFIHGRMPLALSSWQPMPRDPLAFHPISLPPSSPRPAPSPHHHHPSGSLMKDLKQPVHWLGRKFLWAVGSKLRALGRTRWTEDQEFRKKQIPCPVYISEKGLQDLKDIPEGRRVESETNGQEGPLQIQVSSPPISFVPGNYRTEKLLYSPWRSEQVATGAVPRSSKDWEDGTGTGMPGAPSSSLWALGKHSGQVSSSPGEDEENPGSHRTRFLGIPPAGSPT